MQPPKEYLFKHKGFYFQPDLVTAEYIDSLEDFEIRDSDVFLVTYPKSGTIWTQNILSLIYHEGHRNGTEDADLMDRVPWLEYNFRSVDYINRPSPRLFAAHLPYYLVPKELRSRRAKVIYVSRNPKDVLVSYYHFSRLSAKIETAGNFGDFMEKFLAGEGKDLKSSVLKICNFLGKKLTEKELEDAVDKATFNNMKMDPRTNFENLPSDLIEKGKGHFLRKGTVGDWKNVMTVAQSERFDSVLKERMRKLPLRYCWDIHEDLPS